MKIFIFGGTFDPPHLGHYQIVNRCLSECDKLILMPARLSPNKTKNPVASDNDRLQMLKLMSSNFNGNVVIDDFELKSKWLPNFTIDSITYLSEKYVNAKLVLVLGKDQYINLNKWKSYNKIKSLVDIVCINRPDVNENIDTSCIYIDDVDCNISSSMIRSKISKNINQIIELVPSQVFDYIQKRDLYT